LIIKHLRLCFLSPRTCFDFLTIYFDLPTFYFEASDIFDEGMRFFDEGLKPNFYRKTTQWEVRHIFDEVFSTKINFCGKVI
jgi:hypothetical protein